MATDYHHMAKCALSFDLYGEVSQSVRSLSNTEQDIDHSRHNEGAEGRIKTDQADHQSLRDTLDVCIDALDYASHPDGALMNITTAKIAHLDGNADMPSALDIGQWKTSRASGRIQYTYCPLGKLVVTMDV